MRTGTRQKHDDDQTAADEEDAACFVALAPPCRGRAGFLCTKNIITVRTANNTETFFFFFESDDANNDEA